MPLPPYAAKVTSSIAQDIITMTDSPAVITRSTVTSTLFKEMLNVTLFSPSFSISSTPTVVSLRPLTATLLMQAVNVSLLMSKEVSRLPTVSSLTSTVSLVALRDASETLTAQGTKGKYENVSKVCQ